MGQQQLLLVILVTIVVGIATVVALNIFSTSAEQANHDAVRQDLAQIATSAQGWYIKPAMLGGGDNSFANVDFRKVTFPADSITTNNLTAFNLNGTFVIQEGADANQFVVRGYPSSQTEYTRSSLPTNYFEATVTRGNIVMSGMLPVAD